MSTTLFCYSWVSIPLEFWFKMEVTGQEEGNDQPYNQNGICNLTQTYTELIISNRIHRLYRQILLIITEMFSGGGRRKYENEVSMFSVGKQMSNSESSKKLEESGLHTI